MADLAGWDVVGHAEDVSQLQRAIATDRVGHAYLFAGPDGVGKTTLALEFARALMCLNRNDGLACGACDSCRRIARSSERRSHPDLTVADVDWQATLLGSRAGGTRQRLSIEAIRWLRQDIVSRPVLSRWKVQIVDDAGRLSDTAPDAFLKTVEEPPSFAVIILVAPSVETVPETIRSRSRHVELGPVPRTEIVEKLIQLGTDERVAQTIATVARGRVGTALDLSGDPEALERWNADVAEAFGYLSEPLGRLRLAGPIAANHTKNRDQTFRLLDHCAGLWRDALLTRAGIVDAVAYPDMREPVASFAGQFSPAEIASALRATRRATDDLERNFQARIAIMAMINRWPEIPG